MSRSARLASHELDRKLLRVRANVHFSARPTVARAFIERKVAKMNAARRALSASLRGAQRTSMRSFGAGPPGGYFAEGVQTGRNGYLFGETPPAPGQRRIWEDWEAPWYTAMALATGILTFGLAAKPDTRMTSWAKEEAARRIAAEK